MNKYQYLKGVRSRKRYVLIRNGGPSALSCEPTLLTEIKQGLSHYPQDEAGLHSSCTTSSKVTSEQSHSPKCAVRRRFQGNRTVP